MTMKAFVTGGAGCVGSETVRRLLKDGHEVVCYDNLSSGKKEHVQDFIDNKRFTFVEGDILDTAKLNDSIKGCDTVFHFAANPDIKYAAGDRTDKDLTQNTIGTYNVLEAMRLNGANKIVFSSSSVVYGEASKVPTPEDYGPLTPISLYAASKLACEALISSYCGMFGTRAWIYRFANIVGGKSRKSGSTVLTDFINKLRKTPDSLTILGNGRQKKSYLSVEDCVDGMITGFENSVGSVNIFNLGTEDSITIDEVADIVIEEMKLDAKKTYTGGERGWPGDVPRFLLDISKIKSLGWSPSRTSRENIQQSVRLLLRN